MVAADTVYFKNQQDKSALTVMQGSCACWTILIIKQESPPAWTQEAYRPPRSHSNFLLFRGGGGGLDKNFFSQSEHVSSQIWCQKFFPLLGVWGGGRGEVPQQKFFFPVWTCIKPNLVSKNFPFTETRTPSPPLRNVNRLKLLPSVILRMAGGNKPNSPVNI